MKVLGYRPTYWYNCLCLIFCIALMVVALELNIVHLLMYMYVVSELTT